MKALKTLSLVLLISSPALAESLRLGPDSTSQDLSSLHDSAEGIECRLLTDIPGTVTCITENEDLLRKLMGRVSLYVEGAPSKSLTAENDKNFLETDQARYAGHDIQARDMEDFFRASERSCLKNKAHCLNDLEIQLRDVILPALRARGHQNGVVLAAAASTDYMMGVLSHEFLHARFFLNADYRAKVKDFWTKEIPDETKAEIREALGQVYHLHGDNGDFLLLNEFQAYVLEDNAMYGMLGMISLYYGQALREHLADFLPRAAE